MLKIENLSVSYGSVRALSDVDLEVLGDGILHLLELRVVAELRVVFREAGRACAEDEKGGDGHPDEPLHSLNAPFSLDPGGPADAGLGRSLAGDRPLSVSTRKQERPKGGPVAPGCGAGDNWTY